MNDKNPQTELFSPPREAGDAEVRWLENVLKDGRDWLTAAEILGLVAKPPTEDNKRWVRSLASRSGWVISGQKGYKHIEQANTEEIDHCANMLESQARELSHRSGTIRRNAHKIFG